MRLELAAVKMDGSSLREADLLIIPLTRIASAIDPT